MYILYMTLLIVLYVFITYNTCTCRCAGTGTTCVSRTHCGRGDVCSAAGSFPILHSFKMTPLLCGRDTILPVFSKFTGNHHRLTTLSLTHTCTHLIWDRVHVHVFSCRPHLLVMRRSLQHLLPPHFPNSHLLPLTTRSREEGGGGSVTHLETVRRSHHGSTPAVDQQNSLGQHYTPPHNWREDGMTLLG